MFVHSDLGVEHILADPETARPCGVIDFDWASVGDAALDFVGLLTGLGADATQRIVAAYGAGIDWRRLLCYWWLNPCYELVYEGEYLDDVAVQRAVDTIRSRLSTVAELQDQ